MRHPLMMTAAVAIAAGLFAAKAPAQQLNMDMTPLIQNQVIYWNQGMQAANQAAMQYLQRVQEFRRRTGYMGPLPSPVSNAQLQESIRGLQQSYDNYNRAWHVNSNRTSAAIERWDQGAIRGNSLFQDPYTGQQYWLPSTYNNYHINAFNQALPGYNPYSNINVYPVYGR